MYSNLFKDNNYLKLKSRELVSILKEADKAYHDKGEPILEDYEYDLLKDHLQEIAPKNVYFKKIGHEPSIKKEKIKLPYFLGSQNKIKYGNNKEIDNWFSKYKSPNHYVISEKLDGISCLLVVNKGIIKIYTRGNGSIGTDITFIKDYIKSIPNIDKIPDGLAVRGELLLSKENWNKVKDLGANARNLVAGIINSKTINKKVLSLIDYVIYDVLDKEHRNDNYNMLKLVQKIGFKVVRHDLINHRLDNDELFNLLKKYKSISDYEIDGIVITHNAYYNTKDNKNPDFSFAFKSNLLLDEAEVIVNDVEWNMSKDGYLKPIVKFNQVNLNGVIVKQATGFNADYIIKNKIGIGSIIKVQRSGEVIPHIISIIKEADNGQGLMPKIPYIWNKNHIDIIAIIEEKNREQDIKTFTYFMKTLEIKGVSQGIITKLYDNSFDTLFKIININKSDILKIDGFKEKSAINLLEALGEIRNKKCIEIMNASNIIGRGLGEKKLKMIINKYPIICYNKRKGLEITKEDLMKINGMGEITARQFIENLKKFYDFYEELGFSFEEKEKEKEKEKINKLIQGKHFAFSGFRNKEYEIYIKANNGEIDNSITKETNYLIVKDKKNITGKIEKAMQKGVIIISIEDFENMKKNDL
jgi:NAD-dependent DNA ligase